MIPSQNCYDLTKEAEGDELAAYPDPEKGWSVPTIGVGHTGPEVHEGLIWTQEQVDEALASDMQEASDCVNSLSLPINQNQFDALVDFVFNEGCAALKRSTLLRFINEGNYELAASEFQSWDESGGVVLKGLLNRRLAEKALFLTP